MNQFVRLLLIGTLLMFVAPATGWAQIGNDSLEDQSTDNPSDIKDELAEEEEEAEDTTASRDWGVFGLVRYGVGQGTFVDPANDSEFADEIDDGSNAFDLSLMTFVLSGSYTFLDDYTVELTLAAVQFLTAAGVLNEPNEFRFQDIALDFSWSGVSLGDTGIRFTASAGAGLPTSDLSQTANKIVSLNTTAGLAWALFDGKLTLTYGLTGLKSFNEFTSPTVDIDQVGADNVLNRAGGNETLGSGLIAEGGVNTEWALVNSVGVAMALWAGLRLSVAYALETYWTFDVERDPEFNAPAAEVDEGRGVSQLTRTSISLTYPITPLSEALSLSSFTVGIGTATAYAPKTPDNNSFQFPFWNIDGAAGNSSQARLWVSASY